MWRKKLKNNYQNNYIHYYCQPRWTYANTSNQSITISRYINLLKMNTYILNGMLYYIYIYIYIFTYYIYKL